MRGNGKQWKEGKKLKTERMKNINERGKKAERIKENGIERKEWRTSERMENIGWIKKMRENRKQRK